MLLEIRFLKGIAPTRSLGNRFPYTAIFSHKTQLNQWKNSKQFLYVLEEYIITTCMHEKNSDTNIFGIQKATIMT